MSDRLTPLDATFLELEQLDEGATMHIGGMLVFEALADGTAPSLDALCRHLAARLGRLPRYSQRLSSERTGGIGWPAWVTDPRFDIANHVSRAALPAPGGEAQLCAWAADFFSHRLDRTRPLWEMALVEGLQGGAWALATKTHHALVDGVGSVGVAEVLLDVEPGAHTRPHEAAQPPASGSRWEDLLAPMPGAAADAARVGATVARAGLHAATHPRETFERSRSLVEVIVRDELIAAPPSSINVRTGATRNYTVVRASLPDLKHVGHQLGGSVNDVVLAACTAGLRRMLLSRSEQPPQQGLRAMVPTNVREDGERLALGNRVSSLFVDLPVAEPDPLARFTTIAAETKRLKQSGAATGALAMIDLAGLAPPVLHASLARALYATRLFNLTITNVPGPGVPLYALGGQMREIHPLVPLAAEHALGIAVCSYNGSVVLGLSADRDSTPDLDVLRDGIEQGLAGLRDLSRPGTPRPRRGRSRVPAARGPGAGTAPPQHAT
jgi:diacylglycerol O-acyltransferase